VFASAAAVNAPCPPRPSSPIFVLAALVLLLAALVTAGCQNSPAARIAANPEAFAQLDERAQGFVRDGIVDRGFRREHVLMAMGKPNRTEEAETEMGRVERWIYRNVIPTQGGRVQFSTSLEPNRVQRSSAEPNRGTMRSSGSVAVTSEPRITEMAGPALVTLYVDFSHDEVVELWIKP
jgi:hypothetical protein